LVMEIQCIFLVFVFTPKVKYIVFLFWHFLKLLQWKFWIYKQVVCLSLCCHEMFNEVKNMKEW
jgi:hypothetical protein